MHQTSQGFIYLAQLLFNEAEFFYQECYLGGDGLGTRSDADRSHGDMMQNPELSLHNAPLACCLDGTSELGFCHTGDSLGHSAGTKYARRRLATRILENLREFGKEPIE